MPLGKNGALFLSSESVSRKSISSETSPATGSAWEIFAPAKLNLFLEVLGPRADGFHALETLMVPVRMYDQLTWRLAENPGATSEHPMELRVRNLLPSSFSGNGNSQTDNSQALGNIEDNLVYRAVHLLAKTAGIEPYGQFDLIKRIPIQAGMGGGSSDAAAALLLANQAWGLGYSREQLLPLAAQIGSDVPFFLYHAPAVCRGRGELVETVTGLPKLHFVVAKPTAGFSTADVFRQLPTHSPTSPQLATTTQSLVSSLIAELRNGNLAAACQVMTNRLETAAIRIAPWLTTLRETFATLGCCGHFMTGSGSAYVGVMRSATQARRTARRLANLNLGNHLILENVFTTSSC